MSLTAVFDPILSRVRLTAEPGLTGRYTFATSVEGWAATDGGTVARVASPSEAGDGSLQFTPPGAVATVSVQLMPTFLPMISTSATHVLSMRVRSSAGHSDVVAAIDWYNDAGGYISTGGLGAPVVLAAATWTTVTSAPLTPPVGAVKMRPRLRLGSTPAASNIFNVDTATVTYTLVGSPTAVLVERSRNGLYWTTVRGGTAVPLVSGVAALDDYEFVPNAVNYYRASALTNVESTTITPAQSGVWFKSITRPFLNRAVEVVGHGDIRRAGRNGVFEVKGRSDPIAVTDVRSSRRWTLTVMAQTVVDADALELVLASGDPLYVQTDGTRDIPGGYVVVDEMERSRYGTVSARRYFDLPMRNVAAPGPDVVGATSSWETLVAEFGTWADVLAAFGTWADVVEHVADPSTVIVP